MSSLFSSNEPVPESSNTVSSAMIISFEVIFSISIFGIISACYYIGMRRRKARANDYEHQIEQALMRQPHDSTSTLYRPPPPCYSSQNTPLSPRDVSRLDQAMCQHYLLPRYTDVMHTIQSPPPAILNDTNIHCIK